MSCFPNNKPWITKDLKKLLNKKKQAFVVESQGIDTVRNMQRDSNVRLKSTKGRFSKTTCEDSLKSVNELHFFQ